jgi:hypothetical protein
VSGNDPEQAAGVGDHARSARDGGGPGEGFGCFGRAGRVTFDHGQAAQHEGPDLQRGDVPVREG